MDQTLSVSKSSRILELSSSTLLVLKRRPSILDHLLYCQRVPADEQLVFCVYISLSSYPNGGQHLYSLPFQLQPSRCYMGIYLGHVIAGAWPVYNPNNLLSTFLLSYFPTFLLSYYVDRLHSTFPLLCTNNLLTTRD